MPVSLGRRIRRIGIPLKDQRAEDWKVDLTNSHVAIEARDLIKVAKDARIVARYKEQSRTRSQSKGSRPRRRSRSRKTVEVSRGKK